MSDFEKDQADLIADSMRNDLLSYAMGIYPKFKSNRFAESVCKEIQNALEGGCDRLMLFGPPRHGKMVSNNTNIIYRNLNNEITYGKHGDLKIGYKVLHSSGKWYPIIAVGEELQCDRIVHFNNGESIFTHRNHEWNVIDFKEMYNKKASLSSKNHYRRKLNKPELLDDIKSIDFSKTLETKNIDELTFGNNRYKYGVILSKAFEADNIELPFDPYWYGYWIGDGFTNRPHICLHKSEQSEFEYRMTVSVKSITTSGDMLVYNYQYPKFKQTKDSLIEKYLTASIEQRRSLVEGLIDSDGSINNNSNRYYTSNVNVKNFVYKLLVGLGVSTNVRSHKRDGKKKEYIIDFIPNWNLNLAYSRKIVPFNTSEKYSKIVKIEKCNDGTLGFCIEVDSPDNTYVVGNNNINTHNSLLTSQIAPAWFMGKYPDKKIIAASHTHGLASDMGIEVRNNISSPMHEQLFGKVGSLDRAKAASDNFRTHGKGEYFAVGVGGTPIGKGADVFIIDDPIRNRSDAESEKQREDIKSWYSSSVLTRLEGQGTIILMHQRFHEDDLAGYLLREHAQDGWKVINFPALIEDEDDVTNDYLTREIGEALIPDLHSKEKLLRLKDTMHPRDWMSMYQQRPRNPKGEEFTENHLVRVNIDPHEIGHTTNRYILVDPANSKKKHSDFTAMAVIGLGSDRNYYILDAIRERLDLAGRTDKLIELHKLWRPILTGYEQYGAQSDIQHIQHVQNEINYRFPITQLGGNTFKKEERIRRLVPDMSQGRWYAPEEIIKVNEDGDKYDPVTQLIDEEMIPFPMGKNDDLLDNISRIYDLNTQFPSGNNMYRKKGKKVSPW